MNKFQKKQILRFLFLLIVLFIYTDISIAQWDQVSVPPVTGESGKVLSNDGNKAVWKDGSELGFEVNVNKVTSISSSSTNIQYPSAKLLYDQLALKASLINPSFSGFSLISGDVSSLTTNPKWLLQDNQATSLSFDSVSFPGLFSLSTLAGNPRVKFNSNVEIGTSTFGRSLTVTNANSSITPITTFIGIANTAFARGISLLSPNITAGNSIMYSIGKSDTGLNQGEIRFYYAGAASTSNRLSLGMTGVIDIVNILGTGKVGILTTNPGANLDAQPTTINTTSYTRPFPYLTETQKNSLTGLTEGIGVWGSETDTLWIHNGNKLAAQKPAKTVYVYSINDLPAASGGNITLADNIEYIFDTSTVITLSDRLVIQNNAKIRNAKITTSASIELSNGAVIDSSSIVYTGTTDFITSSTTISESRIDITRTFLTATNGRFFNITSTVPAYLFLDKVSIAGAGNSLGTINKFGVAINEMAGITLGPLSSGLILTNNIYTTISSMGIINGLSAPGNIVTFGGTSQGTIQLNTVNLNNTGTDVYAYKFDTGTTFNGNISVLGGGITDKTKAFAASSYTQATEGFKFNNVRNISDSTVNSAMKFSNGTPPATSIPGQDVYVQINQTGYTNDFSERITNNIATGETIYSGFEDVIVHAHAIVTMDDAGSNKLLTSRFGKVEALARTVTFTNGTDRVNLSAHGLSNGQQVKLTNSGGTLPINLRSDIFYFIINSTINDFQVSLTLGGAAVDFTTDGTGTTTARIATMVGGDYPIRVSSGSPIAAAPDGLVPLKTGDSLIVMVRNRTDSNSINVYDLYKTIKK